MSNLQATIYVAHFHTGKLHQHTIVHQKMKQDHISVGGIELNECVSRVEMYT